MTTAAIAGSTGLVGSHILSIIADQESVNTVYAFTRKPLSTPNAKVKSISTTDSSSWPKSYPSGVSLFVSGLGTTRANAGGFENQRKIDYDLNLDLAKAAKAAGTSTYVLISSAGSDSSSMMGYPKMKGELEDAVKALDFDHTVILRPGLLVGKRNELRTAEFALQKVAGFMGAISGNRLKDFWAQDADVIAKAAVRVGLDCVEGRMTDKVVVLTQADIVRLGRTNRNV